MRNFLLNMLLMLVSLAITYVGAEIAFRIYLYDHDRKDLIQMVINDMPNEGLYRFDPNTGFDYVPNFTATNLNKFKDHFRINEYGFMANDLDPAPYPIDKPAGEYRIAVFGGSFTAGFANYVRWPDLVQDYLNRSPDWRAFVGGKFTRILNFAQDGTGLIQWAAVDKFKAQRFSPDLVIVNFFTWNLMSHFIYRGQFNLDDKESVSRLVDSELLRPLPWYGWYPELVATTMGSFLHLEPRLSATRAYQNYVSFSSQLEAIKESIVGLERIQCMNRKVIVLQQLADNEMLHPDDDEQRWPRWPVLAGLETKFLETAKEHRVDVVNLAKFNPTPRDSKRIGALFNAPIDSHNSDYGQVIYASWVFNFLLERSRTQAAVVAAANTSCE